MHVGVIRQMFTKQTTKVCMGSKDVMHFSKGACRILREI